MFCHGFAVAVALVAGPPAPAAGPGDAMHRVTLPVGPDHALEPDDVLRVTAAGLSKRWPLAAGAYPVGGDGTVDLGAYGRVRVVGQTVTQAEAAVAEHLKGRVGDGRRGKVEVRVDLAAPAPKFYSAVTPAGAGQHLWTGAETVTAVVRAAAPGGPPAGGRVCVIRRLPNGGQNVLPVDWAGIARGDARSNYQVMPGDMVVVAAPAAAPASAWPARVLATVARLLAVDPAAAPR